MSKSDERPGRPEVVLSSTCFGERNLPVLLAHLVETGIDKIELSGNILPMEPAALRHLLAEYREKIRFYVHNYFPAPAKSFVLNLAHPDTAARSIQHCKLAIDLCEELGAGQYSVHAGMAISPRPDDLGQAQSHLVPIDLARSRGILTDACIEVAEYGHARGVELLLENNVVAGFNCPSGVNDRYHLSDPNETEPLLPLFEHPNIGVLLDTGHLKVSARTLGFEATTFIEPLRPHIKVVQLSDNDGTADQNRPVAEESWFWTHIPWKQVSYASLEVCGQSLDTLTAQVALTGNRILGSAHGSAVD